MELRHLRYFVAVAEELNFTRAARRLHTAQPSLSQQIRQLEDEVGVKLLERSKRHVGLTAAGRVMLREARDILNRVEYAVRISAKAASGHAGEIALCSFPGADVKIIPRLRPALAKQLPDVRLVVHSRYVLDPLASLRAGVVDVVFTRGPVAEPDLVSEEVLRERLVVVVPAHDRLARLKTVAPKRLDNLPYVAISRMAAPNLHDEIAAFYQHAKISVQAVQTSDTVLGNLSMVAAGLGFSLLPDYVMSMLPDGVVTRPLDWNPEPTVTIVMSYRRQEQTPVLRTFRDVLRTCLSAAD